MIKIAFFDVDGTILNFGEKVPSKKVIYALNALKESGVLLCMATGRGLPAVPHFKNIDFDILLTFNGSYTLNKKEVIYKNPFNELDANKVINNLRKMNRAVAVSNIDEVFTNGSDPDLIEYFAMGSEKIVVSNDFEEKRNCEIYQFMCSCVKDEYQTILSGTKNVQIVSWWDRAADIIPLDSGKGKAIDKVLAYYGFKKDEAMAFGDGSNDIEMFSHVKYGIAMGNAKDDVKSCASDICKSVKEDGVYDYLVKKGLIKPIID